MHHRPKKHPWSRRWQTWLALLATFAVAGNGISVAGDDHDRARQALEAGEVLPLRTILERVERDYPGQVIDVELEQGHGPGRGRWIYEVKILRPGGALVKLKVDARDGRVLAHKARDGNRH
jgi:uncharacterized membrane protein YkoI